MPMIALRFEDEGAGPWWQKVAEAVMFAGDRLGLPVGVEIAGGVRFVKWKIRQDLIDNGTPSQRVLYRYLKDQYMAQEEKKAEIAEVFKPHI